MTANATPSPAHQPQLVLLNGPTGAGKTTAARSALEHLGGTGRVAVVELDTFGDMAGCRQAVPKGPVAERIWTTALRAMIATVKAYLRNDFSVLVPITYGAQGQRQLMRSLGSHDPHQVLLLPSWTVNQARRQQRIDATSAWELESFDWDAHRRFYEELEQMATQNAFDVVIRSSRMGPKVIAKQLEPLLIS